MANEAADADEDVEAKANEANVIDDANEARADEANKATDATGANEADVINKPGEAEAHEAKEAKANEADNAIVTNKAVEVSVTGKSFEANYAIVVNKADNANVANKAIAVNRAIGVDRANMANKADEASLAEANKLLANCGIAVVIKYSGKLLTLLPFSLTKYFAIFAEVKEYFAFKNNNQLFGYDVQIRPMCQSNSSCFNINNQLGFLKNGCWSILLCSLRN